MRYKHRTLSKRDIPTVAINPSPKIRRFPLGKLYVHKMGNEQPDNSREEDRCFFVNVLILDHDFLKGFWVKYKEPLPLSYMLSI